MNEVRVRYAPSPTGTPHAVRLLFRGRQLEMPSYAAAAIWTIEELSAADASFITRFGSVRRGKRRYVAKKRDDLYYDRPDLPARQMRNGWWIGTNYSRAELERMLRKACEIAGLRFDLDVKVTGAEGPTSAPIAAKRAFVGKGRSGLGDLARRHDDYLADSGK